MHLNSDTYTVEVEDSLVVVTTIGSQTGASIRAMRQAVEPIMRRSDTPEDVLLVLRDEGTPDKSALREALMLLHEVPFRRSAVVGTFPGRLSAVKGLVGASSAKNRVKIFRSEEDARAWLKEDS